MIWIVLLILIVAGAVGAYFYTQHKRSDTPPVSEPAKIDPIAEREDAIVSAQTQASLLGLTHSTNINDLIDKCIEVHEELISVNPEERSQLHSVPGDFKRLIEIHLPEWITKFAKISAAATESDFQKFNELLQQIIGELDIILKNIADRDYVAFASKQGFMEIRYSDKF